MINHAFANPQLRIRPSSPRQMVILLLSIINYNYLYFKQSKTYFCDPAQESAELEALNQRAEKLGTRLIANGMELEITPL